MPNTEKVDQSKLYNLNGEILSVKEIVRQNGKSIGVADFRLRVKTKINGAPRELTVSVPAGKPLAALRETITVGATLKVYGKYETYKNGQFFRAFGAGGANPAAVAA